MAMTDRPGGQRWSLHALGEWTVTRAGEEVHLPRREQNLLALLLIEGRRPRSFLAGRLWPETCESRALANLRSTTLVLRRRAPGLLAPGTGMLGLAPGVYSDVARLRLLLRGLGPSMTTVEEATYLLGVGELLPGWDQEWVVAERDHLKEGVTDRISQVVSQLVRDECIDHALPLARAAILREPMRESAHRALAQIYLLSGDRVAAWQVYTAFRRRSVTEFGVSPSTRFEELVGPLRAERRARRVDGMGEGRPLVPARVVRRSRRTT